MKDKEDFTKKADELENDIKEFSEKTQANDKKITELEREISNTEANLDDTMTATDKNHKVCEQTKCKFPASLRTSIKICQETMILRKCQKMFIR